MVVQRLHRIVIETGFLVIVQLGSLVVNVACILQSIFCCLSQNVSYRLLTVVLGKCVSLSIIFLCSTCLYCNAKSFKRWITASDKKR